MPAAEIELLDDETIGVRFPFDPNLVSQIRSLSSRKWDPAGKRWEIHIAHLAEVMRIFYLHPNEAPAEAIRLYQDRWIRQRLRVVVSNTATRLCGSSIPIKDIDAVTSFPVHGHQYSLKFIEGAWDGRKRLFNRRDLSFPTGLLGRVEAVLRAKAIDYELEDERELTGARRDLCKKAHCEPMRNYQKEAVRAAVESRRGILEMATGAGKTLVAAKIIFRLKRPTIFFVHTKDLLYQAIRVFEDFFDTEIGQAGDGVVRLQPITVATIQTAIRAFDGQYGESIDEDANEEDATDLGERKSELAEHIRSTGVVFFDECHHVPAETCYTVAMQTHAASCRFGLSATPYRADRHDMLLEAALGPKIFQANSSRLIDLGYLVAPSIRFVATPKPPGRRLHAEYAEIYRRFVVENEERNRLIAEEANRLIDRGKSALCLVKEIRHGEALAALIPRACFIHGSMDARKRAKALNDLAAKKCLCLIATALADEGLDVPTLDAVILAGGGRSETKALQRIGRALRPAEGKAEAEIIDFYDQVPYLEEHAKKRLEIYRSEPRFKVDARAVAI